MKSICIMRKARDVRFIASLKVVGTRIEGDRIPLVANEGDVRAIGIVKAANLPWTALAPEPLDNTIRTHLWVRGAETVIELKGSESIETTELELAARIASYVQAQGDVNLIAVGETEQDSGRRLLPALLAAELGWNVVRGVTSLEIVGDIAKLKLDTDTKAELDVQLPVLIVANESASLGGDPSDKFDLIEKFEKTPAQLVSTNAVLHAQPKLMGIELPPSRKTQVVCPLKDDEVIQVIEQLLAVKG